MKSLERLFAVSAVMSTLLVSIQNPMAAESKSPKANPKVTPKATPKVTPKDQSKVTPKAQPKTQPTVMPQATQVQSVASDRFLFLSCSDPATKKAILNIVISKTKSTQISALAGTRLALLETGAKTPNYFKFVAGAPFEEAGAGHTFFTLHGIGTLINAKSKASITKLLIDTASDGQTQSTRITVSPANASATDTGNTLENCKVSNRALLMKLLGK